MHDYETIPERIRRQNPGISSKELGWAVCAALDERDRREYLEARAERTLEAIPSSRAIAAVRAVGLTALEYANNDPAAAEKLLEATLRIFRSRQQPRKIGVVIGEKSW